MSVEVCMLTGRRSGHVSTSVSFGRPARGRAATSWGILSNEELTVHTRHHSFSHGKQRYTEASARPGLSHLRRMRPLLTSDAFHTIRVAAPSFECCAFLGCIMFVLLQHGQAYGFRLLSEAKQVS